MVFSRKPAGFYFQDAGKNDHIGRKTFHGYLFTAGSNGIRVFVNLASVFILARLLVPEDFGYVAMAAAFIATPKMVTGQALSMGIIQSEKIAPDQLSGFFWICLGLTFAVTSGAFVCSPLVAWFFDEPALTDMVRVMTLMILFTGACAIHYALLNRTLQFGIISGIDLVSGVLSKAGAIALAFLGAGYWALVSMPVSYEGVRAVLMFWACRFRPKKPGITAEGRSLLRLGTTMSTAGIITSMANEMDRILIGKFLHPQVLGVYSRSHALGEMPGRFIAWPLSKIAVSSLSRLQNDPEKFQRFFLILSQAYFLVIIPVLVWFFHSGEAIVLLVLGENWKEAIPVFKILVFYFLFKNLARPFEWLLTATFNACATSKQIYFWTGARNVCFIGGIVSGLAWGISGVCAGIGAGFLIFLITCFFFFSDSPYFNRTAFLTILGKTVGAGLISLIAGIFLMPVPADIYTGSLILFLAGSLCTILLFFFGSFLCMPGSGIAFKHMIQTLKQAKNLKLNT